MYWVLAGKPRVAAALPLEEGCNYWAAPLVAGRLDMAKRLAAVVLVRTQEVRSVAQLVALVDIRAVQLVVGHIRVAQLVAPVDTLAAKR